MTTYGKIDVTWFCPAVELPAEPALGIPGSITFGHTFHTYETMEDWKAGVCQAICPLCSRLLSQAYDHPDIVPSREGE